MTEFDIDALPDDEWETLTSAGRAVMEDMDSGRWLAGDIANRCAVRYGETSLTKFATDIGMARAGTLREYARVARFYPSATRVAFREAGLSWSHFRECQRAGEQAAEWLEKAADFGLPVAELSRQIAAAIGAKVGPRKLFEGECTVLGVGAIRLNLETAEHCGLATGQRVMVKVYELPAEAQA